MTLRPIEAHVPDDLDKAFAVMSNEHIDAVMHFSDVLTYNVPARLARLALEYNLPLMSAFRETTQAGGLVSYGPNLSVMVRHLATYLDKIFKGSKAGDLPIELPTRFDTAINLKTAKTLGIEVPISMLARADEVIE